jgi:methylaspartate ammonia-lyase
MTKIAELRLVPIQGAYYYEDIAALQAKSIPDGERWTAAPVTPGFRSVREIAEGVSVGLVLEDGSVHWGDAVAVSYSGKAGRQGVYRSAEGVAEMAEQLRPALIGREPASFRELAQRIDALDLHNASRYGASQAILRAVAARAGVTPTELICREWDLRLPTSPVPIQGSSGNDRYDNADKMIVNRLAALPHTQVDDIAKQLGARGEVLLEYVRWLRQRVQELGDSAYRPTLHLDVHGSIAKIFGGDVSRIADYLRTLEKEAAPFDLRMESVFIAATRAEQIEAYARLRSALGDSKLRLVADEWANTRSDILEFARSGAVHMIHVKLPDLGSLHNSIEAVLECRALGVDTLMGGSCIETELSTQASVHAALACRPTAFLAKPGMGVNEAIMLVKNEMKRCLSTFTE